MMQERRWWQQWETAGIAIGVLIVLVNLFAIVTHYLSGPVFHPAWILFGILLVYVCGMKMGGADTDQNAT